MVSITVAWIFSFKTVLVVLETGRIISQGEATQFSFRCIQESKGTRLEKKTVSLPVLLSLNQFSLVLFSRKINFRETEVILDLYFVHTFKIK